MEDHVIPTQVFTLQECLTRLKHKAKMCVQSLMGSFLDCEGSSVAADDSTPPRRPASGFIAPHLLAAFDASGDACRDDA